ncbi:MAG: DUF4867 family protein [Anaerolineae bacterium]
MSDTLGKLQAANPGLGLLPVEAPEFAPFGRVLSDYDASKVVARAKPLVPPAEAVVYEPSIAALEAPAAFNEAVESGVYGGMPIQVGWCYGKNVQMSGLEYHKGSEVVVCLTDVILLLGLVQDIHFGEQVTFDTSTVRAFYAKAGSAIELPAWTLHFAPIQVATGGSFATLIYLPKGTNAPMSGEVGRRGENALLFGVNKWLIVHPDAAALVADGAYAGMVGADIVVKTI